MLFLTLVLSLWSLLQQQQQQKLFCESYNMTSSVARSDEGRGDYKTFHIMVNRFLMPIVTISSRTCLGSCIIQLLKVLESPAKGFI